MKTKCCANCHRMVEKCNCKKRGDNYTTRFNIDKKRWNALREEVLNQNPLCVICQQYKRIRPATIVDHITPHRGDMDLFWQLENLQSLCVYCHNKKSASGY